RDGSRAGWCVARDPRAGRMGPAACGTAVGLARHAREEGVGGGEAGAGGRGVTHEGEDDPEVPGLEVHRQSLHGPRAGSAEVTAGRRPEEELQAEVRGVANQEEGTRRAEEGR